MACLAPLLDLLLIDDDELLIADAQSISHSAIRIAFAADAASAHRLMAERVFDAVAINVGLPGGFELIEQMSGGGLGVPVVAIAAAGLSGRTLEHTLTIAELRGATLALPKPIDAIELVAAAALFAHAARDSAGMAALQRELDVRLGGDLGLATVKAA
jgi:DNA-binding response OmpR family regulator